MGRRASQRGQTMLEYLIITGVIVVVAVAMASGPMRSRVAQVMQSFLSQIRF